MPDSTCSELEMQQILDTLPQKPPFRFVQRILELSEHHIVAEQTFRQDEYFYKGHFPGDPITPGVILIEAMAQAGVVALGMYLLRKECPGVRMRSLFSECEIEFLDVVRPDTCVRVFAERVFWRRNKLRSKVEMRTTDGGLISAGHISGVGVVLP